MLLQYRYPYYSTKTKHAQIYRLPPSGLCEGLCMHNVYSYTYLAIVTIVTVTRSTFSCTHTSYMCQLNVNGLVSGL